MCCLGKSSSSSDHHVSPAETANNITSTDIKHMHGTTWEYLGGCTHIDPHREKWYRCSSHNIPRDSNVSMCFVHLRKIGTTLLNSIARRPHKGFSPLQGLSPYPVFKRHCLFSRSVCFQLSTRSGNNKPHDLLNAELLSCIYI